MQSRLETRARRPAAHGTAAPKAQTPLLPALPFSERRLLLMAGDLAALNGALALTLSRYQAGGPAWPLRWFAILSGVWLVVAYVFEAYDLRVAGHFGRSARSVSRAALVALVVYLLVPHLTPALPRSRLALLSLPVATLTLLLAERGLYCLVLGQRLQQRVLIVGAGWAGRTIAEALVERGDSAYLLLGFVDDDPAKQGRPVPLAGGGAAGLAVLGGRSDLPALIRRFGATTLVLAITHNADGALLQELLGCLELGVEIIPMPVLYERLTGRVPVMHVGSSWEVALPIDHPGTGALWPAVKRAIDVALALVGLAGFGLLLPVLAAAIYLESGRPIFYSQERVGKGGRLFRVYKLRSMVADAEKDGARWAAANDGRVTGVGRVLRRTHLDELPQLWSILKGDMSLVGPRPERPEFVAELAEKIPFYRIRHAVKPGAAGWALVHQGYGASVEDALLKLQYDLYYIKHQSLWLDVLILLKAAAKMITFDGR